jgi:hypothetical protein
MIYDRMKPSSPAAPGSLSLPIPEMNATTPPILPVFNVLQEINSERHLLAAEIRDGRGCRKPTNSDRLAFVPNIGQM